MRPHVKMGAWRCISSPGHDHLQIQAMTLQYSFDSEKWYLGTPCRYGHKWPGSKFSLRYNHRANCCAGCQTNPEAELPWLFRFIDLQASGVPSEHKLGKLCAEGHSWNNTGYTLRKHGHCVKCEKARTRNGKATKIYSQKYYEANREQLIEKAKHRRQRRKDNGEHLINIDHSRAYRAEYKRRKRREAGVSSKELIMLYAAIKRAGQAPSVARLVMNEQCRHWREYPKERKAHRSQWSAYYYAFRYKCDPAFRRHECQRNSERKAKNRGNHTVRINSKELAARFAQFNNTCAYCGSNDHLIVEHFIPRAKGGPHALGNLLPACQQCNISKRDHEPEQWYQSQSFFSKARWRKILIILGKSKSTISQLPLL